jgi:hypothetical protein
MENSDLDQRNKALAELGEEIRSARLAGLAGTGNKEQIAQAAYFARRARFLIDVNAPIPQLDQT